MSKLLGGRWPWKQANEGLVPVLAWLSLEEWLGRRSGAVSDAQLAGLAEYNLEDRHEGRGLTEVAGADDVRVHGQPLRVVPRLNAPRDAVETADDCWRKCLVPKFVVQTLQAFAGVIQLPLGLGVCG